MSAIYGIEITQLFYFAPAGLGVILDFVDRDGIPV